MPERRSTRLKDCGPVLDKAQLLKSKHNLPPKEGMKKNNNKGACNLSTDVMNSVASSIEIVVGNNEIDKDRVVDLVIQIDRDRGNLFHNSCSMCRDSGKGKEGAHDGCCSSSNVGLTDNVSSNLDGNQIQVDDSRTTDHREWSVIKNRKNKRNSRK